MKLTIEQFKAYCKEQLSKRPYLKPSHLVLMSFYQFEVEKPKTVTAHLFSWLRSVAEFEIKTFGS